MKFSLWPAAREDIFRQFQDYLIEQNAEAAAERFLEAVQQAIEEVCRHPGTGAPRALRNPALQGLRTWPVKGFPSIRIYYLRAEDTPASYEFCTVSGTSTRRWKRMRDPTLHPSQQVD